MEGKTIVIAVDNSKECLKAIDFVLEHFPTGYKYDLLHVQTRPIASEVLCANADAAALAFDGQQAWDEHRVAASKLFLEKVFIPKASAAGAEVTATMLHSDPDGSSNIGKAICAYVEKHKPAALVVMKQNKSAVARLFVGSVTKYCAIHSCAPVIIVPS